MNNIPVPKVTKGSLVVWLNLKFWVGLSSSYGWTLDPHLRQLFHPTLSSPLLFLAQLSSVIIWPLDKPSTILELAYPQER